MGAEAEVGVKNKAGGQVIILAQFSGCHSIRPHDALKTMLLLAQNMDVPLRSCMGCLWAPELAYL